MINSLIRENKNRIWIFGAGNIATALITIIQHSVSDWTKLIKGCIVSSAVSNPIEIFGVHVYELDDIVINENDQIIVAVREKYVDSVRNLLLRKGYSKYSEVNINECIPDLEKLWMISGGHRYIDMHPYAKNSDLTEEENAMFMVRQLRTGVLEDIEVNLADHCNLNCQSCNHFSPIASEVFLNPDSFARDIHRLASLFRGKIRKMMLLGGEPLLNNSINQIMEIARNELPKTTIRIITNGVLLPKMNDDFWESCRENDIQIMITKYPIPFNYDECDKLARKYKVKLGYGYLAEAIKTTYRLPIHEEGDMDPIKNYVKCDHANRCVVLKNGRIFTCPLGAYVNYLNSYFSINIREENDNSISIYDVNSYEEIEEFIKRPIPMCKHCDVYHYEYNLPWGQSKKDIVEWIERTENG